MAYDIYIKPAKKRFTISEKTYNLLAVYKIFWPDDTPILIGKRVLKLQDINPWPGPYDVTITAADQGKLLDIPEQDNSKNIDMG